MGINRTQAYGVLGTDLFIDQGWECLYICRVLSDRYSYSVAMSTLGAFNLAAALVFLACPGASREVRAALVEAERFDQQGNGAALPKAGSCQKRCASALQEP